MHQHQVPARQGQVHGHVRTLVLDRLFGDLDKDLIAGLENVLDALVTTLVVDQLVDVDEAVLAVGTEVEEGRIERGLDVGDPRLVDVAEVLAFAEALVEERFKTAIADDPDAHFLLVENVHKDMGTHLETFRSDRLVDDAHARIGGHQANTVREA